MDLHCGRSRAVANALPATVRPGAVLERAHVPDSVCEWTRSKIGSGTLATLTDPGRSNCLQGTADLCRRIYLAARTTPGATGRDGTRRECTHESHANDRESRHDSVDPVEICVDVRELVVAPEAKPDAGARWGRLRIHRACDPLEECRAGGRSEERRVGKECRL